MNEWADDPGVGLKEYFEMRLSELDRRLAASIIDRDARTQLALDATKEAMGKAEEAMDRRLNLLNEFRAQASDESRKYAQIDAVDRSMGAIEGRVGRNENAIATLQGRSMAMAGLGALFGGVMVAGVMRALG